MTPPSSHPPAASATSAQSLPQNAQASAEQNKTVTLEGEELEKFKKLAILDVVIFNKLYGIKNEQGIKLDFKQHLFLWDIYRDMHPKQVILKAAQVGFSTLAIIKSLWLARNRGMDIIYTLPTLADVQDFVGGKVNRIIAQNPVLKEYVRDRDTVEQKRVGKNVIYYRGTWTEKAALMVSSDLNIYDEEDRSNQKTVQQYASRLQHSKHQWEWHFSNPSVNGNGVERYWHLSDQKEWFIKCNHCEKEQDLTWPDNIDPERKIFQCKYCKQELSNDARRVGRWIAQAETKDYSGYHISLLMAPWVTATQILDYANTKSKEYFYNFVLGLPAPQDGNSVTPDTIFKNLTSNINSQERIVIGCDSGLTKHFVLGNSEGLFYFGKTQTWDTIEQYLRTYPNSIAVIDALPDLTEPRRLREKYPNRVFLCHYSRDRKTMQVIRWGKQKEAGNVTVDRNRALQMLIDELNQQKIPIQGTREDWEPFYAHWKTLYKLQDEDSLGAPTFEWKTTTGNDHWCHAMLYWRIGMDRQSTGSGEVHTPQSNQIQIPVVPMVNPNQTIVSRVVYQDPMW